MGDNQMVAGKLRHLKLIPDIAGAGSLAEKKQWGAGAVRFKIDRHIVALGNGHGRDDGFGDYIFREMLTII
jgi:hypothetical protein